jgi:hypothetical protein
MKTFTQFLEEARQFTGIRKGGKPNRRIGFVTLHHGTDEKSAESIKKTGPRPSPKGSEGPGHYVTPIRKKADQYANIVSKERKQKPSRVSYRVSTSAVSRTSDIPKGLTDKRKTSKEKPVVQNTRTGHVAMDADYANKKMIRGDRPPIIVRKRK